MRMTPAVLVVAIGLALTGCAGTRTSDSSDPKTAVPDDIRRMHLSVIRGLSDQGKPQAALAFLDDYELRFPKDPEARNLRGEALLRIGRRDEAQAVFQALYDAGIRPAADFGLGQASAAKGEWTVAVMHFEHAVGMAPTNVRYLNNYGYALLKTGRLEEAYQALARATELDPKDDRARNNYVLAATRSGREAQANRVLARLNSEARASVAAFVRRWRP